MRTFREKHRSTLKLLTTANDRRAVRTYIEFYHRKLSTRRVQWSVSVRADDTDGRNRQSACKLGLGLARNCERAAVIGACRSANENNYRKILAYRSVSYASSFNRLLLSLFSSELY